MFLNMTRYFATIVFSIMAVGFAQTAFGQTCTPAPVGLVSWWSADGNALDSRSRNNGSATGGAGFAAGQVGQAFDFSGLSDSIQVPDNPNLNVAGSFTAEAWIFPRSFPNSGPRIFDKDNANSSRWLLALTNNGALVGLITAAVGIEVVAVTADGLVPLNQWSHVVVTYSVGAGDPDSVLTLTINGASRATTNKKINPQSNAVPLRIGNDDGSGVGANARNFDGLIDEPAIYNRALSASEILAIFNAGTAGKCKPTATVAPTGLVGWWAGDGNGNDNVGANNGILQNGATFAVEKVGQGFSFNGADQFLQIPDSSSNSVSGEITIEAWIRPANVSGTKTILSKYDSVAPGLSYFLGLQGDELQFIVYGNANGSVRRILDTTSANITTASFTYVAATFNPSGQEMKIYVNGVVATASLDPSSTSVPSIFDSSSPVCIGSVFNTAAGVLPFNGLIDEASLYNRALTQAEITSIFNAGIAGKLKQGTTATGSNISINVGSDATITFATVSAAGTTQQIPLAQAVLSALPAGFTPTGLAYDIATSATVTGAINIIFHLPSFNTLAQFSPLKVLHQEGGVFVDRTVGIDFGSRTLAASVPSLSALVIAVGSTPTAVNLASFSATGYDDGQVLLKWQTGLEVDNLGFNLYREQDGKRVRITPQLVAGSALVADSRVSLLAGRSYQWADAPPPNSRKTSYWLEDVDLKGVSKWSGPFGIEFSAVETRSNSYRRAALLSSLGMHAATLTEATGSAQVESRASIGRASKAALDLQSDLAARPAVKLSVTREGWYRVTLNELAAAGLNPKADPRLLQLFVDGRELPISITTSKSASLESSAAIEFYATGVESASTDTRVYWLVVGSRPGLRVPLVKGDGPPSAVRSFPFSVERKDRTVYFSGLRNGDVENFFGAVVTAAPVDQLLFLRHLDITSTATASLEVALQGVTQLPHSVEVKLNGAALGAIDFSGIERGVKRFTIAQSRLKEGVNHVELTARMGGSDTSLVEDIRLTYQRNYTAEGDSLKLTAPGLQQITIDGFASDRIRVVDVTEANAPKEIIGAIEKQKSGYGIRFAAPDAGERSLIAFTTARSPSSVSADRPSNLRGLSGDFIIITRREFAAGVKPLADLRKSQGLTVALVDIEDIYDEFSFGYKTPDAVKDFLAFARSNWKTKPRFVLLAGDGSYDPKNYLGFGEFDFVPTRLIDTDFMETSSDDWFSDFDGDGISDIATGRLPARSGEELATMVSKIINHQRSGPAEETLLVADADDGFGFEQATDELRSLIPSALRITQVNRGRLDPEMARRSLFEALYRKQFLVNYVGHGSVHQWRADLLTNDDALALRNEHMPMFVMMTCLNGYFDDPALDSLGESLMKAERGGAVAVWASSGMTLPTDHPLLNQELYRLLFNNGRATTIGEAVMRAKAASSDSDVRRTWTLLGDPTMKLN